MKLHLFILALLCPLTGMCQTIPVSGTVVNEQGQPIPAATVSIKRTDQSIASDSKGRFTFQNTLLADTFIISAIGYQAVEQPNNPRGFLSIILPRKVTELDQVIINAYGTTTQRLNTGSIARVGAADIGRQPVSNPLAALQGRVPGLLISQSSGVPGSAFNVAIRGRSSLDLSLSRNDPLFIIDGVPFEPGNAVASQLISAASKPRNTSQGGLSPLHSISPSDIESIEVLKDADATAIYGSRGAAGVILITTKKAAAGRTSLQANVSAGFSRPARSMQMMNTQQYLGMRREAIANDGFTPQADFSYLDGYAPDLLLWDTLQYVDYTKELTGNTAHNLDAQLSLSGGTALTRYRLAGSFHRETNVFSSSLSDKKAGLHLNISHLSADNKFDLSFSGFFTSDKNDLIQSDLTQYINLPPNFLMYDENGKPNWVQQGVSIHSADMSLATVPAAELLKRYSSLNENLSGNLLLGYRLNSHLSFRTSLGYNRFSTDENSIVPQASLNPVLSATGSSSFGHAFTRSWIIEPQFNYIQPVARGNLHILVGATWQQKSSATTYINATDFNSDLLLYSPSAAGRLRASGNQTQYRYTAFFGRVNYNWRNKYILNLSARRDGSTRFGPSARFENFSSVGAAWLMSEEGFMQKIKRVLSFAKLRLSYGTTGNDQIGDYKYLDLWSSAFNTYQGAPGLLPSALYNPSYQWEINKKWEAAAELGFFNDRILITTAFFRHRSSNQLVAYALPNQAGFSSVIQNFPALVQNSGVELSLTSKNITAKNFSWSTAFNITFPKNKLVSFPGLAQSAYAFSYREGLPLSTYVGYNYLGVDPATGVYTVQDLNNDGQFDTNDYLVLGNTDPKYYGGLQNTFSYKNILLSFFFEGRKQTGKNYLAVSGHNTAGRALNSPVEAFDRWQHPGDVSPVQKFTSSYTGPGAFGAYYLTTSSGAYTDASFIRLKNIHVAYSMPSPWLKRLRMQAASIYVQAQNLFVITSYLGSDPETQDLLVLPPLRTITAGFQITF